MTSKKSIIITLAIIAAAWLAVEFVLEKASGVLPILKGPAQRETISPSLSPGDGKPVNTTGIPLALPPGFSISIFAENLPGARVMAFDSFGNMWVSQTSQGVVSLLEVEDGEVKGQNAVLRNLKKPHGLAFDPDNQFALYVAEEHRVSRIGVYSEGGLEKIADLPSGGGHFTRTLGFGPDSSSGRRLYVSIGSSCNVCNEEDDMRAKIFSMKKDGGDLREYARGLRNAVFFTWHPDTGKMWTTEMGRDNLGDDLPPDEINIVEAGKNYGWPICYGKNIHDSGFDKNTYIRNPCMEPFETASHIDLQAHSAPLGLVFAPNSWPDEYRGDLLVAYHGSWNRSEPTGYKLVRIKTGSQPRVDDFITGWFNDGKVFGRPVGLTFGPDGALYVSDDHAGLIYRIEAR